MASNPYIAASKAAYLALGFGAFIHFNMSTFTGTENDGGNGPLTNRRAAGIFTPYSSLSDAQTKIGVVMDAFVAAGFKYIVPTTQHGGGYCIWPSVANAYNCVAYDGQPDILKVMCDAARARGMKVGLYHGLDNAGNGNEATLNALVARYVAELGELLSGTYGSDIVCMWLDGGDASNGDGSAVATINGTSYYTKYTALRAKIESLQPACLVFFNDHLYATTAGDMVLFEELGTLVPKTISSQTPMTGGELCDSVFGPYNGIYGSGSFWFCNPADDHPLKAKAFIRGDLTAARKYGHNFLLNVPMGTSGGLTTRVAAYLTSLGNILTSTVDIALNASTSATSCFPSHANPTGANGFQYGPQNLVNGSMNYWSGGFFASDTTLNDPTSSTASATITLSSIQKTDGAMIFWADDGREGYNQGIFFQLLDANANVIYSSAPFNDDGSQGSPLFYAADFPTYSQAKSVKVAQKPGTGRAGGMTITSVHVFSGGSQSAFVTVMDLLSFDRFWPCNDPSNAAYIVDRGTLGYGSLPVSSTAGLTSVASPLAGGDRALSFNGSTHGFAAVGANSKTDNFTMMLSLLPSSLPQNSPRVLTAGESNSGGYALLVGDGSFGSGSRLYGEVATVAGLFGSSQTIGTTTPLIAFLMRNNSTWQLYVGGALIASDPIHPPAGADNAWTIGAYVLNGPTFLTSFVGTVAGAGYKSAVLTPAQIGVATNAANGTVLTAGVLNLVSYSPIQTVLHWTVGTNGSLPITGQLQVSVNGGNSWSNINSSVEGEGLATDNTTTNPSRLYRVLFSDGVSANVYSNVVSVPTYRGLHHWLSWLPAFP